MFNYASIPEYMRPGIQRYIELGTKPGKFLMAIFENNLTKAAGQADHINRYLLFDYAQILYNEVPLDSWGSPLVVRKWIDHQGLKGLE